MSMFAKRPAVLAHLSDEAAARALSKHFGNFIEAAKDLGVDRKDLRRLTWHNPAILDAAHERMQLFISAKRDEITRDLMSNVASIRRRAIDRMYANPELFGDLNHPLLPLLAPAGRRGRGSAPAVDRADEAHLAQQRLARETAAELARDRERERVLEQERERTVEREREAEVMVACRPLASRSSATTTTSSWPAWIRRPTRRRR